MGKIEIHDKHEADVAARINEGSILEWSEEPRNYLGMSQIGHPCKRKLWFDLRGYGPLQKDGRVQRIFELGKRVEDMVVKSLMAAGYRVENTGEGQSSYEDCNGYLRGHGDGLIYGITTKTHLLEIKSANKKKFEEFQAKGYTHNVIYAAQLEAYMHHEKVDRALAVVMCKDNCELYVERVRKVTGAYDKIRDKAWSIIRSDDFPEFEKIAECHFCNYKNACFTPDAFVVERKTCGSCQKCRAIDDGFYCEEWKEPIPKWGLTCDKHVTRYPKSVPQSTCDGCKKLVGKYCLEYGDTKPGDGCRMKE